MDNSLSEKRIRNVKRVNPVVKKIIVNFINAAGSLLFLFRRNKFPEKPKKILFISLFFLGDVIFQSPLMALVNKIFPDAVKDVWIKSRTKNLFEGYPYISKKFTFDDIMTSRHGEKAAFNLKNKFEFFKELRKEKYDLIIDLTGNFWTAFASWYANPKYSMGMNFLGFGFFYNHESDALYNGHLIDKYLRVFTTSKRYDQARDGIPEKTPSISINEPVKFKIDELFTERNIGRNKFIVIHTTAGWGGKKWDLNNFISLISLLPAGYDVMIIGGKQDSENAAAIRQNIKDKSIIDLTGKISVIESAEVIRRAALFIGADSGPLYMAEAVGTPSISLFGPTNPLFSAPIGSTHHYIYNELFCSAGKNEQYCKLLGGLNCRTHDCMKLIKPENVMEALNKTLGDAAKN